MQKILNYVKNHKKVMIFSVLVILFLSIVIFKHKNQVVESYTVEFGTVSQSVVLSGTVKTSAKADLGFADSGRVSKIYVKNNQKVSSGQILAQLEIEDLLADLKIKEANLRTTDLDLKDAKQELDRVIAKEDAKVSNAYRSLLSEDLELVASENDYTVSAPEISGIYDGSEGKYKIIISQDNPTIDTYTLRTFNLENTKVTIKEEGSTILGTKGLYVSFPDDLSQYVDTIWYLEIPNKTGSAYLSNYNSYVDAKNARDIAIKDAELTYEKLKTKEGNPDSVALAEIQKIRAEIKKNTIYAPFAGIVTNIEKEVGENAGVGERVLSVLGEEHLEVVLQVSELDVSRILPDSQVSITLDAFPGENFIGVLKNINSRETDVDGVPVYEAFVELSADSRIKTGMSASGLIVLNEKKDVLSIPNYYIEKADGKNFVSVLNTEGKIEKKEVVLGLVGSDSMVEVLSGLTEGDKIVKNSK